MITSNNFSDSETNNLGFKNYTLQQDQTLISNKFGKAEYLSEPTFINFHQKLNLLKNNPNIKSIGLYFKRNGANSIGTSNYFYLKLKSENDLNVLEQYCSQKDVQIVKQVPNMDLWYILSTTNTQFTSLELSNQFYESGLFSDIDPAFIFNFRSSCSNDTDFGSLWGLHNSVNPSIDINACQAWGLSQGEGINIAIVDQGIHLTHNDLSSNIHPYSFNSQSGTSPSVFNGATHGTYVAGVIGAIKDNNLQVVGIAPLSKIMAVSHPLSTLTPNISAELASGISWAYQNGADVINNSWGDQGGYLYDNLHSTILENSILNAMILGRNNKGTLVVFASGNTAVSSPIMDYPATFNDNILAVGSINNSGQRSIFNPTRGSGYGNKLDIVAPGSNILTTIPNNQTGSGSGTSLASPYAAGVCALILSANPCLTGQQVRDIIEQTAQKVGGYSYSNQSGRINGDWNNEMGYGLIDAFASVQLAQSMGSANLDLYVRDGLSDTGIEPNTTTQFMWTSDDIWVRNYNNDNDFGVIHQNPEYYVNGNPNYVKVRVKNKSCVASSGNEQIKLYWAKAATALAWPTNWDGTMHINNIPLGGEIGTLNIPVLQPGQETVITFNWVVPNPEDYTNINPEPWHFCLLSRIIADQDPMASTETWDINANTRNNNNIAWKNVTVVDILPDNLYNSIKNIGGVIAVGNPFNYPRTFFLEMVKEDVESGKAIYEEAEVGIKMDEILYQAWERGGKESQLLDETLDDRKKVVKGNNVIVDNISFEANERGTLYLSFNFLTKELTEKDNFRYHVIQKDAVTGDIIGGETYVINKGSRLPFEANAGGDKEVNINQPITISAEDINEPAIYNWYDTNGNLIFQGKELQIANAVAEKFKLEVISTVDGFKDYTEVEVKLKPNTLETITPNPATNHVNVGYNLNDADSAYLMTIGYYGSNEVSNNYILDLNLNNILLNVSNYPSGFYTFVLVVNGQIVDAKTLIKH